jgi:hypothetical protein
LAAVLAIERLMTALLPSKWQAQFVWRRIVNKMERMVAYLMGFA